jgi:uncharacterized protein (TIGR00251 family)
LPAPASSWHRPTDAGLLLHLRVTPNAGRDAIEGVETRDDGASVLRIRVAAVPDRGRANAAVIALLAKALGVPKTTLSLVSGETSRFKTVLVNAAEPALMVRMAALGA